MKPPRIPHFEVNTLRTIADLSFPARQNFLVGRGLLFVSAADWASVRSGSNEIAGTTIGTSPHVVEGRVGRKHNRRAGSLHVDVDGLDWYLFVE